MIIKRVDKGQINDDVRHIRKAVFCEEQGFSVEGEFDNMDDVSCFVLLYDDKKAVATARFFMLSQDVAKIGRIAVLKEYRKMGLGRKLMEAAMEFATEKGAVTFDVGAQQQAIGFYESIGFTVCGEKYDDEGVPHYPMIKRI
ncbi:MAG: GNAT family N-acetyltransferase [Oscillospiraceae bacterium]|nr:GNAT family N-acetyltransferase [Oscillospiraceae bacterium]